MPDVLKGVNDRAITEVETGFGQKILVDETKRTVRKYQLRETSKSIEIDEKPVITIANKPAPPVRNARPLRRGDVGVLRRGQITNIW